MRPSGGGDWKLRWLVWVVVPHLIVAVSAWHTMAQRQGQPARFELASHMSCLPPPCVTEAGVEEGRELFKESFAAGKLFAQAG